MNSSKVITYTRLLFRIVLAALLIVAGYLKIQDNSALFETVAYLPWVPLWIKSIVIDLLPYVEIIVGGLLLTTKVDKLAIPATTLIYLSFFIFAIYGFSTGIEGDCGCFGDLEDGSLLNAVLGSTFGWQMVIRNGIFVVMAGVLFLQFGKRSYEK
ncbi:MAG: MauE/DoxX family redox-associated membrane protein [Balneolaceae bacterium]